MVRKGKESVEEGQLLKIQRVMPLMLVEDNEWELLWNALEIMGCLLLLVKAWGWKQALPAQEILVKNLDH